MMTMQDMRTSPKKARKPQARSLPLREAILAVAAEYERMSLRQLYYQLVSRGLPKTERAYKRVGDAATQLRLDHSLDYRKIVDGSRTRFGQTLTRLRDRRYTLDTGRVVIVLAAGKRQGAQLWELREESEEDGAA